MTIIIARRCRRCRRDNLPPQHFRVNRKTCRTCLEGVPYPPEDWVLVVPRPRPVRRRWPPHVLAAAPLPPATGPCPVCGKKFRRKCKHQRFCSKDCRHASNWRFNHRAKA